MSSKSRKKQIDNYDKIDWNLNYKLKKNKIKYVIGKGQFGVLMYEPYKSEILPHWRYKDVESAKKSTKSIMKLFKKYLKENDFVGADMAKKYLHMGNTRSLRYAKYKGGVKYNVKINKRTGKKTTTHIKPTIWHDYEKYKVSRIFRKAWKDASTNKKYLKLKEKYITERNMYKAKYK